MLQINGIHKYFAPDDAAGAPGAAAPQQEPQAAAAPPVADALTMTQAEFDRRVQKALDTARATWEKGVSARIDGAVSEAQRLAAMTADQRAAHDREQTEKALAQREAAVTRRELTAQARETLAAKGLPQELAEVLDYGDADKCSASIDRVSKAFEKAVTRAVDDKLRQKTPPAGEPNKDPVSAALRAAAGLKT